MILLLDILYNGKDKCCDIEQPKLKTQHGILTFFLLKDLNILNLTLRDFLSDRLKFKIGCKTPTLNNDVTQ